MIIYVWKVDYRSYGHSQDLWDGNVIPVEVPDDFIGGAMTYNRFTGEFVPDAPYVRTAQDDINDSIAYRDALVHEARSVIHDWTVELGLGTISDEDKAKLAGWMAYIKALNAMKFEGGPDSVAWPDKQE